ncbi:MAG: hypothetical protein CM15mP77_3370 [Synechococcus sp.]|nr:MAG: hypothetical protein CM15mP77_3370 [Synechococcus sp.]
MLEGRLRMNTVPRQDGMKEKRAEFTLARMHPLSQGSPANPGSQRLHRSGSASCQGRTRGRQLERRPLVPDTDEIPF